jgi:hypothetical protein
MRDQETASICPRYTTLERNGTTEFRLRGLNRTTTIGVRESPNFYLPPAELYFATATRTVQLNRSCQDSGKLERRCRNIARQFGKDEQWIRKLPRHGGVRLV